jgi:hypothetical protein
MFQLLTAETVAKTKSSKKEILLRSPVADLLQDGDSLSATTFPNAADA